jgi:hypothetical protein
VRAAAGAGHIVLVDGCDNATRGEGGVDAGVAQKFWDVPL